MLENSEGTHPRTSRVLPTILTWEVWGRDSGRVSASLQLHMKDMSGTSLSPRGPVINNVGRRALGKSILENKNHTSHWPSKGLNLTNGPQSSWERCALRGVYLEEAINKEQMNIYPPA